MPVSEPIAVLPCEPDDPPELPCDPRELAEAPLDPLLIELPDWPDWLDDEPPPCPDDMLPEPYVPLPPEPAMLPDEPLIPDCCDDPGCCRDDRHWLNSSENFL